MTRLLTGALRKEWCEHRTTLGMIALALPLLLAMAAGWREGLLLTDPELPRFAAAAGSLMVLLAVGVELLPRDLLRSRYAFLERLPAGPTPAYAAKWTLFLASSALIAGLGWALATAIQPQETVSADDFVVQGRLFVHGAVVLAWLSLSFAASTWVPRGALAPIAAAVAVLTIGWPGWLFLTEADRLYPRLWELSAFLVACVLSSVVSGWAAFCRGARREGSSRRVALFGVSAASLILLPTWAWAGLRLATVDRVVPHSELFRIQHALLSRDGRHAYVTARMAAGGLRLSFDLPQPPERALIVALEDGAWSSPSDHEAFFVPEHPSQEAARLWRGDVPPAVRLKHRNRTIPDCLFGAEARTVTASEPAADPRPWHDAHLRAGAWAGLGVMLLGGRAGRVETCGWWDPSRERVVFAEELVGLLEPATDVRVLLGLWLAKPQRSEPFVFLDPARLEVHAVEELSAHDCLGPCLDDGRVLIVRNGASEGGGIVLFDPDTRELVELAFEGARSLRAQGVVSAYSHHASMSIDRPILLRVWSSDGTRLMQLDLDRLRLRALPIDLDGWTPFLVGCVDGRTAVVCEGGRRLVAIDLESMKRRVLFPRD